MRPKIAIPVLVVAFVVLVVVALFRSSSSRNAGDSGEKPAVVATSQNGETNGSSNGGTNTSVASRNLAAPSEQLRQAILDRELEQIQTLRGEVDGSNNPVIISALLEKMANPEAQVRRAVIQALMEINDTNAVPGMQKAADDIADPREKVSVLDAIAYIQAPNIFDSFTPEQLTNQQPSNFTNFSSATMNPRFMRKDKKSTPGKRAVGGQAPAPAVVPANPGGQ
jgi:hypothetical protein